MTTSRGRKSAAELQIGSNSAALAERVARPDPPDEYDLSDEHIVEWWAVVNRMPADWFPRETHGLLASYCRHIVTQRRVGQLINEAEAQDPLDIGDLDRLYKMQEREGRAISSLATRMRLSQHSSYDKKKSVGKSRGKAPWQS